MRSTIAHVEPLPLVPATWMMLSLGSSASSPRRWYEGARGRGEAEWAAGGRQRQAAAAAAAACPAATDGPAAIPHPILEC